MQGGGIVASTGKFAGKYGMAVVCDMEDQDFQTMDDEAEPQNFYVSFLGVGYVKNTLLSCGDDGYLFLWEKNQIQKRCPAHEDSVMALDTDNDSGLFVTGSLNGTVFLWRLVSDSKRRAAMPKQAKTFGQQGDYSKDIEKLATFNLAKGLDSRLAVLNADFNV
jgi:WD40 repeat protein